MPPLLQTTQLPPGWVLNLQYLSFPELTSVQEFLFTVIGLAMNMRTRRTTNGLFGDNEVLTIVPSVTIKSVAIAATSTGPDLTTLLVYCFDAAWNIVELTGTLTGGRFTWTSNVKGEVTVTANSKLAVTRTKDGVSLLFVDTSGFIHYWARNNAGVWGPCESQLLCLISPYECLFPMVTCVQRPT